MEKVHIATIGFLGLATLGYSGYIAYEHSQLPTRWKQLTPLDIPLVDQGNNTNQATFEAGYSEPHYLTLAFPQKTASRDANSRIVKWNDPSISKDVKTSGPDIQWQLLEKGKLISSGNGEQISAWIGQSVGIVRFDLKSGHQYTLVTKIGPRFQEFLSSEPRLGIQIGNSTVSIGLAIDREIGIPFSISVGSVGLLLLLVAIGNYVILKIRTAKTHA